MRRHSSAAQSACSEHTVTSPAASASGLPMSIVMFAPISFARAREREVEVLLRRERELPDHLVGGGIEDVLLAPPAALEELAVDVEEKVFVHEGRLSRWRRSADSSLPHGGPGHVYQTTR